VHAGSCQARAGATDRSARRLQRDRLDGDRGTAASSTAAGSGCRSCGVRRLDERGALEVSDPRRVTVLVTCAPAPGGGGGILRVRPASGERSTAAPIGGALAGGRRIIPALRLMTAELAEQLATALDRGELQAVRLSKRSR
jgi:hypothetical protein